MARGKNVLLAASLLLMLTAGVIPMARPSTAQVSPECAAPGGGSVPTWQVGTAVDDQTPCNLRTLLIGARSGDSIVFDPVVFPQDNPTVLSLRLVLPQLVQGDINIESPAEPNFCP